MEPKESPPQTESVPHAPADRVARLQVQVRKLILMRETGPKRAAWHAARTRTIWRLHDQIRQRTDETTSD